MFISKLNVSIGIEQVRLWFKLGSVNRSHPNTLTKQRLCMCVDVTVGGAQVVPRRPELAAAHFSRNPMQAANTAVNQKERDNGATGR